MKELEDNLNNYKDNSHGIVGQWQDYDEHEESWVCIDKLSKKEKLALLRRGSE